MTEPVIKDPAEQRATRWLAEVDVLRARVAELERERDEAWGRLERVRDAAYPQIGQLGFDHMAAIYKIREVFETIPAGAARRELEDVRGRLRWRPMGTHADATCEVLVPWTDMYGQTYLKAMLLVAGHPSQYPWIPLSDILAAIELGGE